MKDYYLWFLILFVAACACILCYKNGYNDGYNLGVTLCPALQHHTNPHDQKDYDRPDSIITPQQEEN